MGHACIRTQGRVVRVARAALAGGRRRVAAREFAIYRGIEALVASTAERDGAHDSLIDDEWYEGGDAAERHPDLGGQRCLWCSAEVGAHLGHGVVDPVHAVQLQWLPGP
eukprot:COSAG02_NODE_26708_length_626_cov_1.447818_1_plen_109_part_00